MRIFQDIHESREYEMLEVVKTHESTWAREYVLSKLSKQILLVHTTQHCDIIRGALAAGGLASHLVHVSHGKWAIWHQQPNNRV